MVTEEELQSGTVYPDLEKIRQISVAIATAVCQMAYDDGLAQIPEPSDLREYIRNLMYHPEYKEYVAV
jgi:malate dehydrogenase (oxaloacetate-decarboxylating)(NADP+)